MSGEKALVIATRGRPMIGILHQPVEPRRTGVVVVVGGPQYRVGSHRQFVLLARQLAELGYPVLRFDCRGMGDSGGEFPGFEHIADDIAAAVDRLCAETPQVKSVVLWGLCDAASAALMYAFGDRRIGGLVLLNPWVRSEATLARAYLRHYYIARLFSRDFWAKVFAGRLRPGRVAGDLAGNIRAGGGATGAATAAFVRRMRDGLERFTGPVLLVLSGNDITAAEFTGVAQTPEWQRLLLRPTVTRHALPQANHTFSTAAWRDEVAARTAEWLRVVE